MKKLIFTIVFALIMSSFCITSYADGNPYDYIKVGLFYDTTAKSSVVLDADGGFSIGYVDENGFNDIFAIENEKVTVAINESGTISVSELTDTQQPNSANPNVAFKPNQGFFKLDGTPYRGILMLIKDNSGKMTVINYLPLEEYLYSVVGSEMPSSWNIEALKAQAVCARCFAIKSFGKHSSLGFNVCSTTNCQVYKGINGENEATKRAVDETRGKLLKYNGEIVETLFFSADGGHTASSYSVWGSNIPYLCGVPDPYESEDASKHTWSATLSLNDIKNALLGSNIDIGDIVSLDAKINDDQRVAKIDITGTNGTYTLKNQSTYSVFYSNGVLSQKFTLTPYGSSSPQSELIAISSGSAKGKLSSYNLISGNGTKSVADEPNYFVTASGTIKTDNQSQSIEGYVFNGGGWGHGVGMSQYGAKGMAEQGFGYNEILTYFYPGTYLE